MILSAAIVFLAFKGVSSEGQSSFLRNVLTAYVEETAASVSVPPSQNQLADINSLSAYLISEKPLKQQEPATIQGNSLISRGMIFGDILDGDYDRGTSILTYTVQEGDTLTFIASDFGVSIETIFWANNLKNADAIKPGMELKIPPVDGIVHRVSKGDTLSSIAKKYGIDTEKIANFNLLPQSDQLQIGQELIVPGGKMPASRSLAASFGTAKSFAYLPSLGDYFMTPTTGYNWGRLHGRNGVDIANSCGTPVYAAASGTVNLAKISGWNGGFGKFLRISHPNGTETLYAHLSKLLIGVGSYVEKGQIVAFMGTTGRSTGCHLHFEVHGARNPLARY